MQNAPMLSVDTPSYVYSSPAERGFVGRMLLPMKRGGHSGLSVDMLDRGEEKAQVDEDPIQLYSTQRQHSGSSRTPDPVQSWSTGTGPYTKARYPRLFERTRTPGVGYTVVTADDWAVDTPHRQFSGTGPYSSPPQRAWAGPAGRNLDAHFAAAEGLHWEVNKKTLLDLHGASLDGISVLLAQAGQEHMEALDALERRLTYSLSTAIVEAEVRAHARVLDVLEARDRSIAAVAMLSGYGATLQQTQHLGQLTASSIPGEQDLLGMGGREVSKSIQDAPAHQHHASTWYETVATGSESAPSLASPVPEPTCAAPILGQGREGKEGSHVLPPSLDSGPSPSLQDGSGFLSPPVPHPHLRPRVTHSTTKRGQGGGVVPMGAGGVSHSPTTTTSNRSPTKAGGDDLSAGMVDDGAYMPLAAKHVQMMKPGADSTPDPAHTLRPGEEVPLHVYRARAGQAAVDAHIARMEAGRAKAGLVPHVHGADCAGSDKGWPCREGDDVDAAYSGVGAGVGTDGTRRRGSVASITSTASSGLYPPNRHSLSNLMKLHAHTGAAPSAQS